MAQPTSKPSGRVGLRFGIVLTMSVIAFVAIFVTALAVAVVMHAELPFQGSVIASTGVALTVFGSAGLVIHSLTTRLLAPLTSLHDAMHTVGTGEFGRRLEETGLRDLRLLARRFNVMAERLEQSHIADVAHTNILEHDVASRASEIERANEQLRTLDQAKDAFLSNVSHEMRTPLTSIMAATEILQHFTDDDPDSRQEFLGMIDKEAHRLLRIIESILDFAKIEAREIELDTACHDLRDIVAESTAAMHAKAADRGLTMHTVSPSQPVSIDCDRSRVRVVIEHLLDNAIKFSPEEGRVDVALSVEANHATLRIMDEGFGVPREKRSTLFAAFRQSQQVLTDKPEGVGIGLALSSGIVKAHQGNLTYEERDYRGSCFVVQLPVTKDVERPETQLSWSVPRENQARTQDLDRPSTAATASAPQST